MRAELLAPAGNLEKAKIALLYGADAVYVGGVSFSLRARASNFTIPILQELVLFAHKLNKKVYVTTNIVFHDEDLYGLDEYLLELDKMGVDAIICSSFSIIERAKAITNLEIHLSTQFSVTNHVLADYFYDEGIKRVVLARELSLEEISSVSKKTKSDLEVFIHGGMCVSYSGRCTLSNYMVTRDANRGGCAHSCRWLYNLYENNDLISVDYDFQMSSKDLEITEYIPDLLDLGVTSLKIEGRMKSIHYVATVVLAYRMLIDDYYNNTLKELSFYKAEIKKAENRLTSIGFLAGETTVNEQLYNTRSETPTKEFIGIVIDYLPEQKLALIEQRNYFVLSDEIEIVSPKKVFNYSKINTLLDEDMNPIDVARHPLQKLYINIDFEVKPYDLIRRVKQ
ncbi:MAG: U32 family peptidase [Tenericutes bacterium]|nr:U32 family peptidase [Mycoplasmatota bacterium]